MPVFVRWTLIGVIVFIVGVVPVVYFRYVYTHSKRLREVTAGKVYRSGQMTVDGFADAVQRLHLRTIINFQDEYPDPDVDLGYFTTATMKETELCARLGVRYVYIPPVLISRRLVPAQRPPSIDQFLKVMDDPDSYPVLLHCRAGLHRTGCMVAVYRMEYQGWSPPQAICELKENGFGEWVCDSSNDYITQFILSYKRGVRQGQATAQAPR
jgi:tyrosine-protein phosphatase SIW14